MAIIVGALAGCAQPAAPPATPAMAAAQPTTAAGSQGSFDGVYRPIEGGQNGIGCSSGRLGTVIRVSNGTASMTTTMRGTFEAAIAPNGSLLAQRGQDALSGQFSNGHFVGTYQVGRNCHYDLKYDRS